MAIPQLKQSNFADLYGSAALPVLEEIFRSNLMRHPQLREVLFKTVKTDREIYQATEVHDMPQFSSISEGVDYTFGKPLQGYDKTFTIAKYGYGFSISEEAIEDGKFNFVADAVAKLAKSALETQEVAGMNIFNNGFASETTPDGQYLFATAHTTPTGTYSIANKPTTDVDLSFESLSAAIAAFRSTFRGDSGIYYKLEPKYLVVPTSLELYALQLVNSALKADSANNNINPFHMKLQVVSSPHLTDSDAWFLVADNMENGLRIVSRKGIETKAAGADVGFMNDSMFYKCRYREALGAVNCIGLYGTTGAA